MDKLSVLAVFKFELAVFVCLKTGGYLSKAIPSTFLSTFFFQTYSGTTDELLI